MLLHPHRKEVMKALEPEVEAWMQEYLIPAEKIWQPTDLLPDSSNENFYESVRQIREEARELPYDFWVVLVADAITEEALPTYESWIMDTTETAGLAGHVIGLPKKTDMAMRLTNTFISRAWST
jgi:acyl-[acyl-carrier-protein] desaturase